MGACFTVNLELTFLDEAAAVKAMQEYIHLRIAKALLILPEAHKGSHVPMLKLIYNGLQSFCFSAWCLH